MKKIKIGTFWCRHPLDFTIHSGGPSIIFNKLICNHIGGLVFAFLDCWGPSDYVYKIWLSLDRGIDFDFLLRPPPFWAVSFWIFRLLGARWLYIQNLVGLYFYFLPTPHLILAPEKIYFRYYRFILKYFIFLKILSF